MGAIIRSVGVYCPERVLTNAELVDILNVTSNKGTDENWIVTRTGIEERRIAEKEETNQTMAVSAAINCLDKIADWNDIEKITRVKTATNSNRRLFPNTSMCVIRELQAQRKELIDQNAAGNDSFGGCGGINLVWEEADALIMSGRYKTILPVGSEHLSSVTDYSDRSTCILFGDGALATLLTAPERGEEEFGFVGHYTRGCSDGHELITCEEDQEKVAFYDAVEAVETRSEPIRSRGRVLRMNGREVYKYVVSEITQLVEGFEDNSRLNPHGIKFADLAGISLHQVNDRIIGAADERAPGFREKCEITLPRFGNTSTASQGLPLLRILEKRETGIGDYILMVGFGSGLVLGANLYRVSRNTYGVAS